jgi:putative tricarboxylic transport membrane protein
MIEKGNLIVALALQVFGVIISIYSHQIGLQNLADPGPGLYPFLLGILLFFLSFPLAIGSLKTLRSFKNKRKKETNGEYRANFKKLLIPTAYMIGYFLFFDLLGFLIASFLFLFGLFLFGYPRQWVMACLFSAVVVCLSYLVFYILLQVPFPAGLL